MADYVENSLTICNKNLFNQVVDSINGLPAQYQDRNDYPNEHVPLTFNKLLPVPSDLLLDHHKGYLWQEENWGTIADALDSHYVEYLEMMEVAFQTKWEPPVKWFERLADVNPSIEMILASLKRDEGILQVMVNNNGLVETLVYWEEEDPDKFNEVASRYFLME